MHTHKDLIMRFLASMAMVPLVALTACSITQKPVSVTEAGVDAPVSVKSEPVVPIAPAVTKQQSGTPSTLSSSDSPAKGLALADLVQVAKSAAKSPTGAKKYAGELLRGQAKFVKAPKGNPNAVVADVRISGLGEVSLWCRNVVGTAPAGRMLAFEGTLTGSVYTSEDFSHDVTMKDCRFH